MSEQTRDILPRIRRDRERVVLGAFLLAGLYLVLAGLGVIPAWGTL